MTDFGISGAGAKAQIRPGGGFRQTFDSGFSDEYENAGAVAAATAGKQTAQQAAVLGQTGVTQQQAAAGLNQARAVSGELGQAQTNPRRVSNLKDELLIRPSKDVFNTLKSFFDIDRLLNINPNDSPEKKAKKATIARNWQKLTSEEQAYVRQKFQEEQSKKQEELQAEQRKKEKEAELAQEVSLIPPSSPKRGPLELVGSQKQQTAALLQNRRTQLVQVDS